MNAPHPSPLDCLDEVLDCLAEVLDLDPSRVDPDGVLTEAGLESFSAVRLRRRIREDLDVDLPLTVFLDRATPRTVALAAAVARGDAPAESPRHAPVDGAFPLTPIQTAYLVGRDPSFPLGGVATFFYVEYDRRPTVDPEQDLQRLEAAWNRLVARHPMLRMVIGPDARQHIRAETPAYRIDVTDLRGGREVDAALARLRAQCSHQLRPVDTWPLFDLRAALLPDGRTRLYVGMDIIALDMASWMLLMREWGLLVADPEAVLPPTGPSFAELLTRRESDPEHGARRERAHRYWAARASALPPGPALPWAASAVELGVPHFTRHAAGLTAEDWAQLRQRCASRGLTPTAVLLAAGALVLHRWGATAPFCLNTTLFDRPDSADLGAVVGDFTTTVLSETPPIDLTTWSGFVGYATDVNRRWWTDLDHREVSAVEVLRERRTADLDPGYPVVFTSGVGLAGAEAAPAAWLGEEVFGVSQTPQVLIDHIVWDEGGRLRIAWDVVDGCLPDGFADGLRDAHHRLLCRLARDESAWTDPALGWDPSFQEDEAIEAVPFPDAGPLLDDPLRHAALVHPHRPALIGAEELSHAALADRAARTASALRRLGIGAEELVAVAAIKGTAQIAATLGVTASGAGYVPVEPGWPASRIASVCAQAGIRHALLAADVSVTWPGDVRVHVLDPDGVLSTDEAAAVPGGDRPRPDGLAYAIFTSGSTGRPKGVAVEHRQARTTVDEMANRFPLTPDDRVLALSAMSFDLSVYDVFGVLGAGAAMVLPEPDRQRDPGHWLDLAGRHRVTIWNSAPALLEMLVEYAEIDPDAAVAALSSLRLVLLSGDWIPVTLPDRLRALAPRAQVVSLGGATEGSIWSICYPIGGVDPSWPSIPYGRALAGQSFHIVDPDGHPCPVGVAGELVIGGDGVARGYVGDPEQTAHRFTSHPVLRRRVYRTGDLGRWRYDGTIEFLGRLDRQVKIRGHRIELGEIESVLDRAPGVRQCVARAAPGPDGRPRLVAYVVPADPAAPPAEDALVGRARDHLPEYMVPSRFVFLPALPVTVNGKVDHAALPDPYRSGGHPVAGGATTPAATVVTPVGSAAAPDDGGRSEPALPPDPDAPRDLESLLVAAVRAGLGVRVDVDGGALDAPSALSAAARLATAAGRITSQSYAVTVGLGAHRSLLTLAVDTVPAATDAGDPSRPAASPVDERPERPDPQLERKVAAVFHQLLDAPVDVDTPFFRMGATSLTLVLAHRRLAAEVDPELAIVDLFAQPTVRGVAQVITARRTATGAAPASPVRGRDDREQDARPLTRRQARALAAESAR